MTCIGVACGPRVGPQQSCHSQYFFKNPYHSPESSAERVVARSHGHPKLSMLGWYRPSVGVPRDVGRRRVADFDPAVFAANVGGLAKVGACSPSCARLCSYARRLASSITRARPRGVRGELHLKMSARAVAETPGRSSRRTRSSLAQRAFLGGGALGWWTPRALNRSVAKRFSHHKGSSRAQGASVGPRALRALRTSLQSASRSPSTGRRSCWLQNRLGAGRPLALRYLR